MNDGWLDLALLMAILAAIGGLYWQMFNMNERLARVETHLQYLVPRPSSPAPEKLPED